MIAGLLRTNEENRTFKKKNPSRFKLIYAKQASSFLLTEITVLFYTSTPSLGLIHPDDIVGKPSRGDTIVRESEKVYFQGVEV